MPSHWPTSPAFLFVWFCISVSFQGIFDMLSNTSFPYLSLPECWYHQLHHHSWLMIYIFYCGSHHVCSQHPLLPFLPLQCFSYHTLHLQHPFTFYWSKFNFPNISWTPVLQQSEIRYHFPCETFPGPIHTGFPQNLSGGKERRIFSLWNFQLHKDFKTCLFPFINSSPTKRQRPRLCISVVFRTMLSS